MEVSTDFLVRINFGKIQQETWNLNVQNEVIQELHLYLRNLHLQDSIDYKRHPEYQKDDFNQFHVRIGDRRVAALLFKRTAVQAASVQTALLRRVGRLLRRVAGELKVIRFSGWNDQDKEYREYWNATPLKLDLQKCPPQHVVYQYVNVNLGALNLVRQEQAPLIAVDVAGIHAPPHGLQEWQNVGQPQQETPQLEQRQHKHQHKQHQQHPLGGAAAQVPQHTALGKRGAEGIGVGMEGDNILDLDQAANAQWQAGGVPRDWTSKKLKAASTFLLDKTLENLAHTSLSRSSIEVKYRQQLGTIIHKGLESLLQELQRSHPQHGPKLASTMTDVLEDIANSNAEEDIANSNAEDSCRVLDFLVDGKFGAEGAKTSAGTVDTMGEESQEEDSDQSETDLSNASDDGDV